jgi:hypothetical protein
MLEGLGFGIFQAPNNRNMLLSAPKETEWRNRRHAGDGSPAGTDDRVRRHGVAVHRGVDDDSAPRRAGSECSAGADRRSGDRPMD